ncbi:phosphatase PAP2 family protein [Eubacterium sp.]|uniref:phosphatase PAP2 family protein n=1 Tax=Eubacterium sp. TaxID=142586 RepID=UPI002FCAADD6
MDIQYLLFLQNIRFVTDGAFNGFFSFVTTLGESTFILLLMAGIYWCVDKRSGSFMGLGYTSASMINQIFKITFCVYRPWIRSDAIEPIAGAKTTATGYSFPSGHSAGASSAYGSLAIFYRKNKALFIYLLVTIAMVMLSRNFLGVHTPQDVIVGCLVGSSTVIVGGLLYKKWGHYKNFDIALASGILVIGVALIIYATTKSYPVNYVDGQLLVDPRVMIRDVFADVGLAVGAVCGWLLERRFVNFKVEAPWNKRIIRYLIGAAVVIFWKTAMTAFIKMGLGDHVGILVSNIILMLFIFVGYPLIFKKIFKREGAEQCV